MGWPQKPSLYQVLQSQQGVLLFVAQGDNRRGEMMVHRFLTLLILAAAVAGCGGSPDSTKFTQTWAKSYDVTTCTDWKNTMDNHQRFVAAGDMLLTIQNKRGGDGALPADDKISSFALDISDMCNAKVGEVATIIEIAPLVYVAFESEFKP